VVAVRVAAAQAAVEPRAAAVVAAAEAATN
jgi:hypothetical protein